MSTYILQKGEYHHNRNILVTSDVKKVASYYVRMINEGMNSTLDKPFIEIWNENDEDYPTAGFDEQIKDEQQLVKYLSKLANRIGEK